MSSLEKAAHVRRGRAAVQPQRAAEADHSSRSGTGTGTIRARGGLDGRSAPREAVGRLTNVPDAVERRCTARRAVRTAYSGGRVGGAALQQPAGLAVQVRRVGLARRGRGGVRVGLTAHPEAAQSIRGQATLSHRSAQSGLRRGGS